MNLTEVEREVASLDAVYRPVATAPVDLSRPGDPAAPAASVDAALARLGAGARTQAVLRGLIELYAAGDEADRAALRRLFDRHAAFRWAAGLPGEWTTAAQFRARLILLSARDQGADTRDEILALRDLCARARTAGIDVDPILDEVAAMSSDVDRYGMGSMRAVLLEYGRRRPA